jgi:hypothetical protein
LCTSIEGFPPRHLDRVAAEFRVRAEEIQETTPFLDVLKGDDEPMQAELAQRCRDQP